MDFWGALKIVHGTFLDGFNIWTQSPLPRLGVLR